MAKPRRRGPRKLTHLAKLRQRLGLDDGRVPSAAAAAGKRASAAGRMSAYASSNVGKD